MPFIDVEPDALFGVAGRIQSALPSPASGLAGAGGCAGNSGVAQAIESFLDRWSYGLQHMNKDARDLADLLTRAGRLYAQTEADIVAAEP